MGWRAAWGAGIPWKEPKDHCYHIKLLGCLPEGRFLPLPMYLVLNSRTALLGSKPMPFMHRVSDILKPT